MDSETLPTFTSDVKDPLIRAEGRREEEKMPARSLRRRLATPFVLFVLVAAFYFTFSTLADLLSLSNRPHSPVTADEPPLEVLDHELVPLEAHIMSKCPDAQVCELK